MTLQLIITEAAGYLATAFLAVSLLVKGSFKFRIINSLGCLSFIIYGFLINAPPVILTNFLLLTINSFMLVSLLKISERIELIRVEADNRLVEQFLLSFKEDILRYFPDFKFDIKPSDIVYTVLRDMAIANIFIAEKENDETLAIKLNYTIPAYRDYKVGRFLFMSKSAELKSEGISTVIYRTAVDQKHGSFLKKMGFQLNEENCYYKKL